MKSFLKIESFLNKVGDFFRKFIYITLTTFISFVISTVFMIIYVRLIDFFSDGSVIKSVLQWAISLTLPFIYTSIFSFILIRISKTPKGDMAREAREDFENGYPGFMKDIKNIFKRELLTLGVLLATIMLHWFLWAYCFRSMLFIVFIPLNPVYFFAGVIMLPYCVDIIFTYILCAVFICVFYILELAIIRKKWYKRNFNERIEK